MQSKKYTMGTKTGRATLGKISHIRPFWLLLLQIPFTVHPQISGREPLAPYLTLFPFSTDDYVVYKKNHFANLFFFLSVARFSFYQSLTFF